MNSIELLTKEELGLLEYAINLAVGECAYDDIKSIQKLEDKIKLINKQLEEYQLQNINLKEDIMIKKKSLSNKEIKDKTFWNLYDMPTYEDLENELERLYSINEEHCKLNGELRVENKKLKTQLSGTTFCYDEEEHQRLKDKINELERTIELSNMDAKEVLREINYEQAAQQKEFMNYLQNRINYYKVHSNEMGSYDYDGSKLKLSIYQDILLKYSEIVNTSERV